MDAEQWRSKVDERLDRIESRLVDLEIYDAKSESASVNLDKRLSSIEDTLKWLVRLVIGALIMALLGITFGI